MKVLGFLVTPRGNRDERRGVKSKTIRASSFPSAVFRPSTDTRETDEEEGPFFDLVFPLSLRTESETESDVESHDLFFSGGLLPLVPSETRRRSNFVNSPRKFRELKLGGKKMNSKSELETNRGNVVSEVPLFSLFSRESGLRGSNSARSTSTKLFFELASPCQDQEKRSSPLAIQKYFSKIKPFYVKVSKGFGEKLRFGTAEPTGIKLVARRLRKSRSASSAVAAVRSPQSLVVPQTQRRDDTLLEKEDGIEGAIAHCKRSFNKGSMELPLARSRSDPGEGKRVNI
ncbi:putative membrane-associated kinase regulator 2 isoform X2 [Carex littledalei]|uniref:Putative membrane-associated kinase regulator 2 isoform X2 n=1 Tax=Carex littledalei TaxID=544730 RepID=A0A833QM82_9POAL|nr:putative membrane-associated kinase regulator 2 isoform X2 [Carex littledalei]